MEKRRHSDTTNNIPGTNRMKSHRLGLLHLIVAPLTFAVANEHQHYCGKSWPDAFDNCYKPCPTQSDSECSSLGNGVDDAEWKCFGYTGCVDKLGGEADDSSGATEVEQGSTETVEVSSSGDSDFYCGATWTDAMVSCKVTCPSGDDTKCPDGHLCFAAANCAVPLITLTSELVVSMAGPDSTMDDTDQGIFGDTLKDFISDAAGGEGGLSMKGVSLGQQFLSVRRLSANVTGVDHRKLPIGSSALDVSVTVTGEYRPPPYLDLDVISQNSINRDSQAVVSTLQERGNQMGRTFFQRVEGIEAIQRDDFTKRPTRTPTNRPTTKNPTGAPTDKPVSMAPTDKPVTMAPTISPTSIPSDIPSLEPSNIPSSEPSRALIQYLSAGSDEQLLVGGDTTSSFGYLFNIRTKADSSVVIIKALEFFTKSTKKMKFELWSRVGSFKDFKGSLDGWENIAKGSVVGEGPGRYTSIPPDKFVPVDIPGGGGDAGTRAFYLTLRSKDLVYSYGKGLESDSVVQMDTPDLEVWEGEGVLLFPMPDRSQEMYYRWPRQFLGSIYYDRLPCRPYSAFGDIQELPCPELPTQSPTEPQPTLSPVTPASSHEPITPFPTFKPTLSITTSPSIKQTFSITTSPTLQAIDDTAFPSIITPAPQMGINSPTASPTVSKMPSSAPSSSYPTLSPVVRMQANIVLTLHNVPERVMEEREMIVFTETTQEFLHKYTEQTLILDAINVWHQQIVEVDAITSGILTDEWDNINTNITDVSLNMTEDTNPSEVIISNETGSSAGGFAGFGSKDNNEMASGFADFDTDDAAGAMAGGFADIGIKDTENEMASGFADFDTDDAADALAGEFADMSEESTSDEMAGGFVEFDSQRKNEDQTLRKLKAGGGGSSSSSGNAGLDQDKLDKIIAFKQKHSDRGPKTAGVQVTLILRIPFAYIPEDLLGKYTSVIIQEHGVDLVRSLREQSLFYTYFRDVTGVSSDAIGELTPPPTNMPTSYAQFLAFKQQGQTAATPSDGQSFATLVWISLLLFWFFLTGVSVCCLVRARMQMKERLKMEALLSQERSSSKPLIKQERPDSSSYDSSRSKGSTDEEEIVSSFGASFVPKESIDDKSCASKARRHTTAAFSSKGMDDSESQRKSDNNHDDDARSSAVDRSDKSKVSKSNRKTMSEVDAEFLASSGTVASSNLRSSANSKTMSASDTKSLASSSTRGSSKLSTSGEGLLDKNEDFSSSTQKRKTLSESDTETPSSSKTKPSSSSRSKRTAVTADNSSRTVASKAKTSSNRKLEANLEAMGKVHGSLHESKSSSRQRRKTFAVDSRKSNMSKSKLKSTSSRDLKADVPSDSQSISRQQKSAGRRRHTTVGGKSVLDKLNSFDIV